MLLRGRYSQLGHSCPQLSMLGRVDVGVGAGGGQDASLASAYRPHAATACVHNMQQLLNQSMPANCANHPMVKFRQHKLRRESSRQCTSGDTLVPVGAVGMQRTKSANLTMCLATSAACRVFGEQRLMIGTTGNMVRACKLHIMPSETARPRSAPFCRACVCARSARPPARSLAAS
ncbi:unnamed protein product [Sphagnum balticum]